MKVDASTVMSIQGRIGIMLEVIGNSKRTNQSEVGPEGPHELKRPSEILYSELMIAQQGPTTAHIDGKFVVVTPEGKHRHRRRNQIRFMGAIQCSPAYQQPRAQSPTRRVEPLPGQAQGGRDVILMKISLSLLAYRRAAAQPIPQPDSHERDVTRMCTRPGYEQGKAVQDEPHDARSADQAKPDVRTVLSRAMNDLPQRLFRKAGISRGMIGQQRVS